MFTLQANAITTALRGSNLPDSSAQDMVNAMCNCAQTIEHRGSLDFTYDTPWSGNYPGLEPPSGRIGPLDPNSGAYPPITSPQIPIPQIAPWQNIPWNNIGPPTFQPFQPNVTVNIPGPTRMGPTETTTVVTGGVTNTGPTINYGPVINYNETRVDGPLTVNNTTRLGDTVTNKITNLGDQIIEGDSLFLGQVFNFGPTFNAGPTFFGGPIIVDGRNLGRMRNIQIHYVNSVWLDAANNKLVADRRVASVLGLWDAKVPSETVVTEACT